MKRILREDFEHLVPARVGKIRVNHASDECKGDSQSLLVERTPDGAASCFCFRCGGRGYFRFDRRYVPPAERHRHAHLSRVRDATGLDLPADLSLDLGRPAREWLAKAGLPSSVITEREFKWSENEQGLYIPVHKELSAFGPRLAGYIKRSFSPKDYRTLRIDAGGLWGLYRQGGATPVQGVVPDGPLVLTEDVLSALRVAKYADAMALCGTELHPEAASLILTEGWKRAIVFLDGDNPTVKMKARKIASRLSWLVSEVVETGKDPKNHTDDELLTLIGET